MARLETKTIETADNVAAPILQEFKMLYGMVPNFYSALAISGSALQGYLALERTMEKSPALSDRQRELIALAVANYNGCRYCVSGHTFSATKSGMNKEECASAQRGYSADPTEQLILDLALGIVKSRGAVSDAALVRFQDGGLSQELLIEVCAWTAVNCFGNWINNIVDPKIDFPKVDLL